MNELSGMSERENFKNLDSRIFNENLTIYTQIIREIGINVEWNKVIRLQFQYVVQNISNLPESIGFHLL